MSKELEYSRGLANGPIDRKLLRAASDGLSGKEMSAAVGGTIPPEQTIQRVRDLLESRNWATFFEQEQLILESINDILASLREWVAAGSVQHIKAALQALKMKQDALAKHRMSPEEAANIVLDGQARIMLAAIQATMFSAADELARRYPAVPSAELHEVFLMALPAAVDTIERRIEQG
ncbi:hypothetical protein [Frigoribacterium sp. CG_9.8]|uniref:hypothetical protein n=1 Tax=Frigoribacterium sp. CG_9.8 TaxID=2787733 RepID=UPI0018CA8B8C|nr:hypothetical protein [Frigoribacterium sp. CG_9.8]MBG6106558.1 hypothetical protein [Frigoribacterium sp. CG_9.8]